MELHWCRFQSGGDPGLEAALASSLLEYCQKSGRAIMVCDTPSRLISFSKTDQISPGFGEALESARGMNLPAVSRISGGMAVAANPGCFRVLFCSPHPRGDMAVKEKFSSILDPLQRALRELGAEVEQHQSPGEWCPGEFSLRLSGGGKVAGLGQRSSPGAHHICALVTLSGADEARRDLLPVYRALGQPFDPQAMSGLPGIASSSLQDALMRQMSSQWELVHSPLPQQVLRQADAQAPSYLL